MSLLTESCLVIWTCLRYVLTFSYAGALSHYTTQPLDRIRRQQHDVAEVAVLLADLRKIKQQELSFVNQGVRVRLAGACLRSPGRPVSQSGTQRPGNLQALIEIPH